MKTGLRNNSSLTLNATCNNEKSHCERGLESVTMGWLFVLSSRQELGLSTKRIVACCRSSADCTFLWLSCPLNMEKIMKREKKEDKIKRFNQRWEYINSAETKEYHREPERQKEAKKEILQL